VSALRIGDVAKQVGVTPRTIRYYEELGLLGSGSEREKGAHRTYAEADVGRRSSSGCATCSA
jgi:MerR family transcriptional regulator, repressor of the yfmOP operon